MPAAPVSTVLVHSPFLGPASLRPLADALAALGHDAILLDLRPSVVAPPVHQRLIGAFEDAIADSVPSGPVVLVGHSGAGPLLPAFADGLDDEVVGLIYLDAGLPTPGLSWRDTAPADLYASLRAAAKDGLLPRWRHWFTPDPLDALVADEALRQEIADECPEVGLAYLKEPGPTVTWPGPAGYVAISEAYTDQLTTAAGLGWPTRSLDLHHLAPATDPEPVAVAILEVLAELG